MRDSISSTSTRTTAWMVAAPLALVAALGLARTVWGGPPASEEPTADAEGPASEPASADDPSPDTADPNVDPTLLGDPEAAPESDAAAAAGLTPDSAPSLGPTPAEASGLRMQMETGMSALGELAVEARSDDDLVRATCVLDKQDRAGDVMELGTSEMLVIRDPNTSEQARGFALEKLDAAASRIDKLVEEAKECAGQTGPEDEIDITRNESDEPNTVPMAAPSLGLGQSPVPPPVDGGWPPAASPIE